MVVVGRTSEVREQRKKRGPTQPEADEDSSTEGEHHQKQQTSGRGGAETVDWR